MEILDIALAIGAIILIIIGFNDHETLLKAA